MTSALAVSGVLYGVLLQSYIGCRAPFRRLREPALTHMANPLRPLKVIVYRARNEDAPGSGLDFTTEVRTFELYLNQHGQPFPAGEFFVADAKPERLVAVLGEGSVRWRSGIDMPTVYVNVNKHAWREEDLSLEFMEVVRTSDTPLQQIRRNGHRDMVDFIVVGPHREFSLQCS